MASEIDPVLTGAAFDLANGGYRSMPDKDAEQEREPIDGGHASLREAADRLATKPRETVVRKYTGPTGELADPDEAVTLARAARDYGGAIAAERSLSEKQSSEQLAAEIDASRAHAAANDPNAADLYGFDVSATDHQANGSDEERDTPMNEASRDPGDRSSEELDTELERALRHPHVLQAIEERVGEAERARQSYREGLEAATQIAQASFFSQFPEFAGMAQQHIPAALELMSRQDPAKFARIQAMIATTEQLFARREHEGRHRAEAARQNFQRFADAEDARLAAMLKGEPEETQRAVLAEIISSAKDSGIEAAELNHLFNTEPLMRHATFQRMMYDAGKYRMMMKAKSEALARPVPAVQRPGMAATRSERERTDLRALSAKLSTSGDIKDAVALYKARASNRR